VSAPRIRQGVEVLHQRRAAGGAVVLERYTVARTHGGTAVLARRGQRALTRVEIYTLLSPPAWAVQERLW